MCPVSPAVSLLQLCGEYGGNAERWCPLIAGLLTISGLDRRLVIQPSWLRGKQLSLISLRC